MKKEKFNRDVFRSFLVSEADYSGYFEIPCIKTSEKVPNRIIPFSKAMGRATTDFDQWVAFYEDDYKFVRLWNNPKVYLDKLKKFNGVISPDFSLYRNMPLAMQLWNTYRGKALAVWLCNNGIEVIPNVRWNDERTYAFAFNGIEKNKTIAVGTHGCIQKKADREYFKKGLKKAIEYLSPKNIIVYGNAPNDIFDVCKQKGIKIIPFKSELLKIRSEVKG